MVSELELFGRNETRCATGGLRIAFRARMRMRYNLEAVADNGRRVPERGKSSRRTEGASFPEQENRPECHVAVGRDALCGSDKPAGEPLFVPKSLSNQANHS